jgi:elongation factor Ts
MAQITVELLQKLRQLTGAGLLDCKRALEEANGDIDEAIKILRKKGAIVAQKRAGNVTAEGVVQAYIHPGSRIGVLVEVNCETDFVARTTEMDRFATDICVQIAAFRPVCITAKDVDPVVLEKEKALYREQLAGKPAEVIDQLIEGKLQKYYAEICLMNQPFIKNDAVTVDDVLKDLIAKVGENIKIKRFARFEIGS